MTPIGALREHPSEGLAPAGPAAGRDLACTGAVFRLMGRVDRYLVCETDVGAPAGMRQIARQQLQAALVQELLSARLQGDRR